MLERKNHQDESKKESPKNAITNQATSKMDPKVFNSCPIIFSTKKLDQQMKFYSYTKYAKQGFSQKPSTGSAILITNNPCLTPESTKYSLAYIPPH